MLCAILFASFAQFTVRNQQPDREWVLPIIPHPQEVQLKEGREAFKLRSKAQIIVCADGNTADNAVSALNSWLVNHDQAPLAVKTRAEEPLLQGSIILATKSCAEYEFDSLLNAANVPMTDKYPGPEGYVLDITPNYILVAGHDSSGVFYGVQSLLQLFENSSGNNLSELRSVTVVDYPDMPLRSAFYGFYLNAMQQDAHVDRASLDFDRLARYKFNMIDLASHHYAHLEMAVPGHKEEQLWQRFAGLHQAARRRNMRPRVGGWAKWVHTHSEWGVDLSTLEGIRTTQITRLDRARPETLRVASGHQAPNVIYDFSSGKTSKIEPVVVSGIERDVIFQEGYDYSVQYGQVESRDYQSYENTSQTQLEVLFSQVVAGEGEPAGYPLRRGITFNPPTTIQRLPAGRISAGEPVEIAFSYIGPDPWSILKVRYCRSDSRLHTDGPENYLWRWCTQPVRFFGADDFSLDVDETRVFSWDKRCLESGKSRSRIWVDDIRYYYDTIRTANPVARISMWSDMLDPAHNATLYNVDSTALLMAEAGMNDVIMIPWKTSLAEASVRYFARQKFPIMPSCQDVTQDGISTAPKWAALLRRHYENSDLQYGLMHCSWDYGFNTDETWEQAMTVADHAWSGAPYIIHTPEAQVDSGKKVVLRIRVEGDKYIFDGGQVRPGPLAVTDAFVMYRAGADIEFNSVPMTNKKGYCQAVLPGHDSESGPLQYYISVSDAFNTTISPDISLRPPYTIQIQSESIDENRVPRNPQEVMNFNNQGGDLLPDTY